MEEVDIADEGTIRFWREREHGGTALRKCGGAHFCCAKVGTVRIACNNLPDTRRESEEATMKSQDSVERIMIEPLKWSTRDVRNLSGDEQRINGEAKAKIRIVGDTLWHA